MCPLGKLSPMFRRGFLWGRSRNCPCHQVNEGHAARKRACRETVPTGIGLILWPLMFRQCSSQARMNTEVEEPVARFCTGVQAHILTSNFFPLGRKPKTAPCTLAAPTRVFANVVRAWVAMKARHSANFREQGLNVDIITVSGKHRKRTPVSLLRRSERKQ